MALHNECIINNWPITDLYSIVIEIHVVKFGVVNVFLARLESIKADITAYDPNVHFIFLLHFFKLFNFSDKHFESFSLVNWPILEGKLLLKRSTWALQSHHKRFD